MRIAEQIIKKSQMRRELKMKLLNNEKKMESISEFSPKKRSISKHKRRFKTINSRSRSKDSRESPQKSYRLPMIDNSKKRNSIKENQSPQTKNIKSLNASRNHALFLKSPALAGFTGTSSSKNLNVDVVNLNTIKDPTPS